MGRGRFVFYRVVGTLMACLTLNSARAAEPHYKFAKEIPIGGGGGWDYLHADATDHRLFVTHGTKVIVIDTEQDKVVGNIPDTPGVHGFVTAPELGRGFSSNGQENKSSVVDLTNLKLVTKVATGSNPDALLFEPKSAQVWVFNGRGQSVTVYDAKTGNVVIAEIKLGGK